MSVEPSMEEILSSIKRIIAEEGDGTPARQRRAPRAAPTTPEPDHEDDGVLELSHPMPSPVAQSAEPAPPPLPEPPRAEPSHAEPLLSSRTADASRGSLDALSRMIVKPEPGSDGTLEGLVREMIRPMLRDWLDSHLPSMVEAMVAKEIARIASQD